MNRIDELIEIERKRHEGEKFYSYSIYDLVSKDIIKMRELAKTLTIKELANVYEISYAKMSMLLRLNNIKAKRIYKERKEKVSKPKIKKNHEITAWAASTNRGRIRYVYYDMLKRCYKETDIHYKDYGGRGITVCDEWKSDCCNFFMWAKENGYKAGLQLDRKNNDKGYYPDNCHWVVPVINSYNKRNTVKITFKGETHNLKDWEDITGISRFILYDRLFKYKWDIKRALTQKPKVKKSS